MYEARPEVLFGSLWTVIPYANYLQFISSVEKYDTESVKAYT